jgi:ferredoxin--NADP+ reductase
MYRIAEREDLGPGIHLLRVEAPQVAAKAQPGQFVVLRLSEKGERIPMSISDWERERGLVSFIFIEVGRTTYKLAALKAGDFITNFAGPLGMPSRIERFGSVVCVGGGVGIAPIYHIARAMRDAGNHVISIMGARSARHLFWHDRLQQVSDRVMITTNDGSVGHRGLVTDALKETLQSHIKIDRVVAIGPLDMMEACAATTRPYEVRTIVSLNPIMIDGTGMCGGCRVAVGGETRFACKDGPEFDGHEVDWRLLASRRRMYRVHESQALRLDLWGRSLKVTPD